MAKPRPPDERRILCTSCGGLLVVARQAKSVNCHHCHQRVICEQLLINDYVAVRNLRTANRIHIQKKGHVLAAVWCEELEVDGRLRGDAISLGGVRIRKKAQVQGSLRARSLHLEEGASLSADLRIGPEHIPEHEARQQPTETELLDRMESDLRR